MAKKVTKVVKAQAKGGQANPSPPLGPALGQAGVDINAFCTQFNDRTQDQMGKTLPVVITVYDDRTFDFVIKQPPAATMIIETAKLKKGSGEPNKNKVGSLNKDQVRSIAEAKMPDLNARDIDGAMKIIEGTARRMGVEIAA